MQLPKRQSQLLRQQRDDQQDGALLMTPFGQQHLKDDLEDLEKRQRPKAVEDVSRSVQLGDLSENAEYQEARMRLSRIDGRIFGLKERLKKVVLIEHDEHPTGRIRLGSTVVLDVAGKEKTYHIVGPHETNPTKGRISHVSPLGSALLGHSAGEEVTIKTPERETGYRIKEVR